METKVCTKCGPPAQPIENFAIRNRMKGTRQAWCKACQNEWVRGHYERNHQRYLDKARIRTSRLRKVSQEFLRAYLREHPCIDCGESDVLVLEFDHLRDKVRDVSMMYHDGWSLETIKEEIAKCEVVCANCHRRRTARRRNSYRVEGTP